MPLLLVTGCCALAAIGSFLFGYDTGIIASVIDQEDFNQQLGGSMLSDNQIGGIVSAFTGGAIIGTLIVASISDHFGRRAAIALGALLACLGGALQGGAVDFAMMVVGRVFAGLGIGVMSPTIPNFCLEVAPPNLRAMLGGMQQWMIGLGIVTAQWVGYGSSLKGGAFSWRFPLSIQAFPALFLASTIFLIPESPRNLFERRKNEQAEQALRRYRLRQDKENEVEIRHELEEIQNAILADRQAMQDVTWRTLYEEPQVRRSLLLAMGIQLFTQTSGVNVIGYYGPRIYAALGYTSTSSLFIQGIYGALALLWNTVCLAVVDRVGRRKLLIPSMLGMGASLCISATLVHYFDPQSSKNHDALRAIVAMNFVFSVFFTSLGVISWVFAGEVFSTHLRARGTSVSTFTNWAANLVFAQCSPLALSALGYKYFYFFTAFNWIAAVVVWLYYPETQSKPSLEAVPRIFFAEDVESTSVSTRGGRAARKTSFREKS